MQACARQVLGRDKVTFPGFYRSEPEAARCFKDNYAYMWNPKNARNQWWIDAFTCDPRVLWEGMKGIQMHGNPAPVAQNDILNASVGRLPVMLVYICVHPIHGTRIFYPYHGAKAGKVAAYTDYQYWTRDLTAAEVTHLNDFMYYNQPEAHASARRAGCKPGARFDPDLWRVRYITTASTAAHCLS